MRLLAFGIVGMAVALAGATTARAGCSDAGALAAARAQVATQCDCTGAQNHGEYVKCAGDVAKAQVAAGLLPQSCKGDVVECAANSVCGKPGFVTCCRVDGRGHVSCSIKSSAEKCSQPDDGNALVCVGAAASCCDACNESSCQATTSTTSTTTSTSTTTTTQPPYGSASRAFITAVPGLLE